jgi:hypothetical protein
LLRILGVFRVHNGADVLPRVLDALSGWCDDIYAIDDRSTDDSAEILRQHPAVTNLVRARSDLPRKGGAFGSLIAILVRRAIAGHHLTVFGDGSATRDYLHVSDAVDAYRLVLETQPQGPRHQLRQRHEYPRDREK